MLESKFEASLETYHREQEAQELLVWIFRDAGKVLCAMSIPVGNVRCAFRLFRGIPMFVRCTSVQIQRRPVHVGPPASHIDLQPAGPDPGFFHIDPAATNRHVAREFDNHVN